MTRDRQSSEPPRRGVAARVFLALSNLHRIGLVLLFSIAGPRFAYRLTERLARMLYGLLPAVRERCERQIASAMPSLDGILAGRMAERAFVHRMWCLTDLYLAPRWIQPGTIAARGGTIPEPFRSRLVSAAARGQPFILVTAYYGPFDLLPALLGYSGVKAGIVFRRHLHPGFNAYRARVRAKTGCEMIPVERALERLPAILEAGGGVALVADHHDDRRGVDVNFLGVPTRVPRTIGLLAARHGADVITAGIRRTQRPFHFEIDVSDVIDHTEIAAQDEPVEYVTRRYLRGLERIILKDPAQYLWMQARWGKEATIGNSKLFPSVDAAISPDGPDNCTPAP